MSAGIVSIWRRRSTWKPSTVSYHLIEASISGTLIPMWWCQNSKLLTTLSSGLVQPHWLQVGHRDKARLQVGFDGLTATFESVTGILHATEWSLGVA